MDRLFQWLWDRHAARYSWALWALIVLVALPLFLCWSFTIVAFEGSNQYIAAATFTVVAVLIRAYILVLPGLRGMRVIERWAADENVDVREALDATYSYARRTVTRLLGSDVVCTALFAVVVGVIAGATPSRIAQYAVLGAALGISNMVIAVHSFVEGALRPARAAIVGGSAIGDSLPRSRPTFATWINMATLAIGFEFAVIATLLAAVFEVAIHGPLPAVAVAGAMTLATGPVYFASFSPFLRPIRDLARGTERVGAGDYSQRLPVVQDDDLGALAASFNRMQAGLAERQRLQAAFGTYVDPALAARLLEQGDDVFTGERREVTVMFVDIRDFTPFAEAKPAEDVVARLNALFEIMVPAVVEAGGHVNKFLGDGALAVFGAPNDLANHSDAAVGAAVVIHRLVAERFGGELRIGIGINTGLVIAGTIGGGSKLEFTLIGDTVNVAARVEQLTKTTGDAVLLTQRTVDALASRPCGLTDRGSYALKGKSAEVQVYGLNPAAVVPADGR
ncbi:MAG: adenylate/guanylate cyclase domain-containing protein [Mycobacterium sp.]|uniref:adenylate/guanylate cyclase domain-containing protein n=1 Tax=Mycobacterium gordonae TaxID=1778 RepID=UPI000CA96D63|nr:adenylate/guanylate cyclase domain-containing protein [Mycobacterium gordonae]MCQ4364708.1 HAMP domain-containing protein [Mycobacterium gordonae]PJE10348.1 MAG: adenylate/guanylate cyclase domain-containing protein [Mycobacterium sp.]